MAKTVRKPTVGFSVDSDSVPVWFLDAIEVPLIGDSAGDTGRVWLVSDRNGNIGVAFGKESGPQPIASVALWRATDTCRIWFNTIFADVDPNVHETALCCSPGLGQIGQWLEAIVVAHEQRYSELYDKYCRPPDQAPDCWQKLYSELDGSSQHWVRQRLPDGVTLLFGVELSYFLEEGVPNDGLDSYCYEGYDGIALVNIGFNTSHAPAKKD